MSVIVFGDEDNSDVPKPNEDVVLDMSKAGGASGKKLITVDVETFVPKHPLDSFLVEAQEAEAGRVNSPFGSGPVLGTEEKVYTGNPSGPVFDLDEMKNNVTKWLDYTKASGPDASDPLRFGRFVNVDSFDPHPVAPEGFEADKGVKCEVIYEAVPDDQREKSIKMVLDTPLIVPGSLDKLMHGEMNVQHGDPFKGWIDHMSAGCPDLRKEVKTLSDLPPPTKLANSGFSGYIGTPENIAKARQEAMKWSKGLSPYSVQNDLPYITDDVTVVRLIILEDGHETYINGILQTETQYQCKVENGSVSFPVFPQGTKIVVLMQTKGGKIKATKVLDGSTGLNYDPDWRFKKDGKPAKITRVQKGTNTRSKNVKAFLKNNPFFKSKSK